MAGRPTLGDPAAHSGIFRAAAQRAADIHGADRFGKVGDSIARVAAEEDPGERTRRRAAEIMADRRGLEAVRKAQRLREHTSAESSSDPEGQRALREAKRCRQRALEEMYLRHSGWMRLYVLWQGRGALHSNLSAKPFSWELGTEEDPGPIRGAVTDVLASAWQRFIADLEGPLMGHLLDGEFTVRTALNQQAFWARGDFWEDLGSRTTRTASLVRGDGAEHGGGEERQLVDFHTDVGEEALEDIYGELLAPLKERFRALLAEKERWLDLVVFMLDEPRHKTGLLIRHVCKGTTYPTQLGADEEEARAVIEHHREYFCARGEKSLNSNTIGARSTRVCADWAAFVWRNGGGEVLRGV